MIIAMATDQDQQAPWWASLLLPLVLAGFGIPMLLVGVGVFEASGEVPRWVVGILGLLFSAAGLMVLLDGASSRLQQTLFAAMVVCFGCVFAWLALSPEAAEKVALGGILSFVPERFAVLTGRVIAGGVAAACFLGVLLGVVFAGKRR